MLFEAQIFNWFISCY